jgi:hypothetical protein
MVGSQRAIGGVRPDDGHIGHPVAERKAAHTIAELKAEAVTYVER